MGLSALIKKLEVPEEGGTEANRWINNDIKPIEEGRRTWTFWTFHNLWVVTNMNISSYLTGSSLIALGLTWWQALISIVVGSILTTAFIVLNSTPGAFYHLGFPVVNRYVWGMYGSQFVILNRILLSLVWYAVQAWIGGECVYVMLQAIWPSIENRIPNHMPASTGMTTAQFVAYIVFMVISLPLIWIRPHKLTIFLYFSVTIVLIFDISLLIWSLATMGPGGFGSTIKNNKPDTQDDSIGWTIMFGIISTIGGISAGILNQNDYARFAKRPRNAITGQIVSAGTYNVFSCVVGILVTAATQQRYGQALWNLPNLLSAVIETGGSRSRVAAFFAGAALVISQWGINIPGNALSGGFDLAATLPRFINIRRGAYITALLSMVINPWQLLSSASIFLSVLSSYSVFLGPMIGLMISSYYLIHRQKINVDHVFIGSSESIYWYGLGVNWRAPIAWACGVAPSMPGFISAVNPSVVVPRGCTRIYYINFLTGFLIASLVFVVLHWLFPARPVDAFVNSPMSKQNTMLYYRNKWDDLAVGMEREYGSIGKDEAAVMAIPHDI